MTNDDLFSKMFNSSTLKSPYSITSRVSSSALNYGIKTGRQSLLVIGLATVASAVYTNVKEAKKNRQKQNDILKNKKLANNLLVDEELFDDFDEYYEDDTIIEEDDTIIEFDKIKEDQKVYRFKNRLDEAINEIHKNVLRDGMIDLESILSEICDYFLGYDTYRTKPDFFFKVEECRKQRIFNRNEISMLHEVRMHRNSVVHPTDPDHPEYELEGFEIENDINTVEYFIDKYLEFTENNTNIKS